MLYRQLGRTGLHISVIGLGGNQFGTTCDETQTARIVHCAMDLGVNFIDSAEGYGAGASEETLGKALHGRWDDIVLATKTGLGTEPGKLSRKRILQRLESSLRRLGSDHIDLYYLHQPDPTTPLEETLRVLEEAVRAGKVRYIGVSNHPAWQVAEAIGLAQRHGWSAVAASQVRYNLLDRSPEAEMIPACSHLAVSLIPHSPLGAGFLTGKYVPETAPPADTRFARRPAAGRDYLTPDSFAALQRYGIFAEERGHTMAELAIAWLLSCPAVSSVIAGVTKREQVEANVKAAEWSLSTDEAQLLK